MSEKAGEARGKAAASKRRADILLTGFGAFEAARRNPSAHLVEMLAKQEADRPSRANHNETGPACRLQTAILPVQWRRARLVLDELTTRHRPRILLHLGYADCASGFQIEQCAYNETCDEQDAGHCAAPSVRICASERRQLASRFCARALAQKLQAAGLPATCSRDPGRYLCNYIYYLSLRRNPNALFIHLPGVETGRGLLPASHVGACVLPEDKALDGLRLILNSLTATDIAAAEG